MTDPLDFDGLVIATCQAGQANGFYLSENEARAILSAVLPHVLAGPREALEGLLPNGKEEEVLFCHLADDQPGRITTTLGVIRRARTALARIDKLTEGLSREGETG